MTLLLIAYTVFLCLLFVFLIWCVQKRRKEANMHKVLLQKTKGYHDLINATSDGIVQSNLEGKVIFINDAGAKMFGYEKPADLYLNDIYVQSHYADSVDREKILTILQEEGKIEKIRTLGKRTNGETFWVEMAIHFQKDETENAIGLEAIIRDVTEIVKQEGQLKHYSAQLEQKVEQEKQRVQELENDNFNKEKLAAVGQTASILVHELRNPLSSIKMGLTTLLRRAELQDADRRILDVAVREVTHLEKIMRDILSFSRPGRTEFIKSHLNTAIELAIEQSAEAFMEKGLILQSDLDPGIPEMHIDVDKIRQIFVNLFLNSLEAGDLGCRVIVRTRLLASENTVLAEVEDDCGGMSPEALDRAFEPFFSAKKTGTGLGLTIVEKFVLIHGGTVKIVSKPEAGTTVSIRFPIAT